MKKPSILTIALVASLVMSSFSVLNVLGTFRQVFPNGSQLFSVNAAYSFSGPSPNSMVLTQGSQGNLTLTINSLATKQTTLLLSFNSTNPTQWSSTANVFGVQAPVIRDLTMTVNGQNLIPVNSDLLTNCGGCLAQYSQVSVIVNPGVNTYTGTIDVSVSANLSSFSIFWFVSQ